ncbi:hypothetical protein HWI79_3491 [Cryptosporidium felis]|nr:hypothetical protein HWI79_3491 [Cryptosporidium felis]
MNQLNKELMLCGVYECTYTKSGGEIKRIPSNDFYSNSEIVQEANKVFIPYYVDVNLDGISQFESQSHIVLRFNNVSDNILTRLHKMYIIHEGIPVQIHNLNCYLLGKMTKIDNQTKMSLLGSSLKNKTHYYKSIRVVIKIDNPDRSQEESTRFYTKHSIRILIDYYLDIKDFISNFNLIQSKISNDSVKDSTIENSEEVSSDTSSEYYSYTPILMPTMGHR